MYRNIKLIKLTVFSLLLFIIVTDSQTAVFASKNSIDLCIKSVIPNIFPFIFLGGMIAGEIAGMRIPALEQILRIPRGTAGYFIIGHLCGYPVGAKLLHDAVLRKEIEQDAASRMVAFCNNASPAFIIGIMTSLFSNLWIGIILWFVQILSSLLLGILLPRVTITKCQYHNVKQQNIGKIMSDTIRSTATICGWIVAFGILLTFISEPMTNLLSPFGSAMLTGSIELTNGLFRLHNIRSESLRFIVSSALLSFGGICILLQTKSVAPFLNLKTYLFARLIHATISSITATIMAAFLFSPNIIFLGCIPLLICAGIVCCSILLFNKKMVAFTAKL